MLESIGRSNIQFNNLHFKTSLDVNKTMCFKHTRHFNVVHFDNVHIIIIMIMMIILLLIIILIVVIIVMTIVILILL